MYICVDDVVYVYGGFSKEKAMAGGGTGSEGRIHDDMWVAYNIDVAWNTI